MKPREKKKSEFTHRDLLVGQVFRTPMRDLAFMGRDIDGKRDKNGLDRLIFVTGQGDRLKKVTMSIDGFNANEPKLFMEI